MIRVEIKGVGPECRGRGGRWSSFFTFKKIWGEGVGEGVGGLSFKNGVMSKRLKLASESL